MNQPILKPLFLAVPIGYVVLPIHLAVKKHATSRLSLFGTTILSLIVVALLAAGIQATISTLASEMPALNSKASDMRDEFQKYSAEHFPQTAKAVNQIVLPEGESPVRDITGRLIAAAADTLSTAAVVGLYLIFLLLEASRFPDRVRRAFSEKRSGRILETIQRINLAIAHYLTAKVKAGLLLAVPVFIILVVFRAVRHHLGVLTFCNFVPYLGSVIGCSVPVLFALVNFGFGWSSSRCDRDARDPRHFG